MAQKPPRPKQKRDPEATRAAILDAAEGVFAQVGFAGAANSQIADAAGVTKSLIHHYFGGKDGLWEAVKTRLLGRFFEISDVMMQGPVTGGMFGLMGRYFEYLQSHPRFVRLLGWVHAEGEGDGWESGGRADWNRRIIKEMQAQGIIRPDLDPTALVVIGWALSEYWFLARGDASRRLETDLSAEGWDERYFNTMTQVMLGGVLTPEGAALMAEMGPGEGEMS